MPPDTAACSQGQGKRITTDWKWCFNQSGNALVCSKVEGSQVSICIWHFIICLEVTYILLSVPKCYILKFPKAADNLPAAGDFPEINLEIDSVWSPSWWFTESVELYFSHFNHSVPAYFLLCHYDEYFDRMFILNPQSLKHLIMQFGQPALAKNCVAFRPELNISVKY